MIKNPSVIDGLLNTCMSVLPGNDFQKSPIENVLEAQSLLFCCIFLHDVLCVMIYIYMTPYVKGLVYHEATNKVALQMLLWHVVLISGIIGSFTLAKHPIWFPSVERIGDDNIMMAMDSNIPPHSSPTLRALFECSRTRQYGHISMELP